MTQMGLWEWLRPRRDVKETPPPWWERVAKLESDMKSIRLEWEETYESVNRAVRKLGKREQRALQEEQQPTSSAAAASGFDKDAARRLLLSRGEL